jgi:hypothetical protein
MQATPGCIRLQVLVVVFCIVLFFAGVVAPRRSKRLQAWYDRVHRRGEQKSGEKAGKLGDMTEKSLRQSRRAGDRSAEAGRKVREKMPGP